jgi:hypothetical protein
LKGAAINLTRMAIRRERFFWIEARGVSRIACKQLGDAHGHLVRLWDRSNLSVQDCTPASTFQQQIWLFRIRNIGSEEIAQQFETLLESHVKMLVFDFCLGPNRLRRVASTLMPLVHQPASGVCTSYIGLHSGNDTRNGTLAREAGPHFSPEQSDDWLQLACLCGGNSCETCSGHGCYRCYQLGCPNCLGTGWRRFGEWSRNGYRIECNSGLAVANTDPVANTVPERTSVWRWFLNASLLP